MSYRERDYPPAYVFLFYFARALFNWFGVSRYDGHKTIPCRIWLGIWKLLRSWDLRLEDYRMKHETRTVLFGYFGEFT